VQPLSDLLVHACESSPPTTKEAAHDAHTPATGSRLAGRALVLSTCAGVAAGCLGLAGAAAAGWISMGSAAFGVGAAVIGSVLSTSLLVRAVARPIEQIAGEAAQRIAARTGHAPSAKASPIDRLRTAIDSLDALTRRAEEAGLLALLAERTRHAVLVFDSDDRIEWVNDGFVRLTGCTREQVVSVKASEALRSPHSNPDTVELMADRIRHGRGFVVEILHERRNGERYWASIEATPVRDESGRARRYVALMMDVTEAHEKAEALEGSWRRLQMSLDAAPVAVAVCDAEGRPTMANREAERLLGIRGRSLSPWMMLATPEDRANLARIWAETARTRTTSEATFRAFSAAGEPIFVCVRITPLEHGDATEYVCAFEDATTRRIAQDGLLHLSTNIGRLKQQVREQSSAIGHVEALAKEARAASADLLASLGRELNAPLVVIMGYADLLADQSATAAERIEYAELLRRGGTRMRRVIESLMELAGLQRTTVPRKRVACNVRETIEEAAAMIADRLGRPMLSVESSIHDDVSATICTDPSRLGQLLIHMAVAAARCHTGRNIKLVAARDGEHAVRFEIRLCDAKPKDAIDEPETIAAIELALAGKLADSLDGVLDSGGADPNLVLALTIPIAAASPNPMPAA